MGSGNGKFSILSCFFVAISFSILSSSCHKLDTGEILTHIDGTIYDYKPYNDSQIIVWKAPGATDQSFRNWLHDFEASHPPSDSAWCSDCDSSLIMLSGPNIAAFVSGQTVGGGSRSGGGPHGEPDVFWSFNYNIESDDPIFESSDTATIALKTSSYSDSTVTVAVFDTGVDSTYLREANYLYNNENLSCLNSRANNGWDFIYNDTQLQDDYHLPEEHGANVSRLIVAQVERFKQNNVAILPVKTHDKSGRSKLFDILCGLAYAKERGAKIINASFGFYSPKNPQPGVDSSVLLFKEFIRYYLTNNNILLIAAAGNLDSEQQKAACRCSSVTRDLGRINFYPASFAAEPDMYNVIAVTTTDRQGNVVSSLQNYSPFVVDIGVRADEEFGMHYVFANPRIQHEGIEGSSYATPIVTGIICSQYSKIINQLNTSGGFFTKDNIFNILMSPSIGLIHSNTAIINQIKMGKVTMNYESF